MLKQKNPNENHDKVTLDTILMLICSEIHLNHCYMFDRFIDDRIILCNVSHVGFDVMFKRSPGLHQTNTW